MQDFTGHSIECDDRAMDSAESIAWKSRKVTGNLYAPLVSPSIVTTAQYEGGPCTETRIAARIGRLSQSVKRSGRTVNIAKVAGIERKTETYAHRSLTAQ